MATADGHRTRTVDNVIDPDALLPDAEPRQHYRALCICGWMSRPNGRPDQADYAGSQHETNPQERTS